MRWSEGLRILLKVKVACSSTAASSSTQFNAEPTILNSEFEQLSQKLYAILGEIRKPEPNLSRTKLIQAEQLIWKIKNLPSYSRNTKESEKMISTAESAERILQYYKEKQSTDIRVANKVVATLRSSQTQQPAVDIEDEFAKIEHNSKTLEDDLNEIGDGVRKLKEIALEIDKEIHQQVECIQQTQQQTQETHEQLVRVNAKLKTAIKRMMSGSKFFLNFTLVVVLLGLIYFLKGLFTS